MLPDDLEVVRLAGMKHYGGGLCRRLRRREVGTILRDGTPLLYLSQDTSCTVRDSSGEMLMNRKRCATLLRTSLGGEVRPVRHKARVIQRPIDAE